MTEAEVERIYDYLHENYEYRDDGNLVYKKIRRGCRPAGVPIGSFNVSEKLIRPIITCHISLENKRYSMQLKHLIYIYHHKIKPKNITYIDGNLTNTKIENLRAEETRHKCQHDENLSNRKSGATPYQKNGIIRYRVRLSTKQGRFTIGSYDEELIASNAYSFAKRLYYEQDLTNENIKSMTLWQFPSNEHKKIKLKGVSLSKNGRYRAILIINKVRSFHGTYDTPEEAHAAYLKAKEEYSLL